LYGYLKKERAWLLKDEEAVGFSKQIASWELYWN
jgi:hypothetical protein